MATSNRDLDPQYTALIQNDPEIQRLMQQFAAAEAADRRQTGYPGLSGGGRPPRGQAANIWSQVIARGRTIGLPDDWAVDLTNGSIGVDHQNWVERHPNLTGVLVLASIFAPSVIAAATGPAAGTTAASTAAGTTAAGTTAASTAAGTTAAGTTAATGASVAGRILAGTQAAGRILGTFADTQAANRANDNNAAVQFDAAERQRAALDIQRSQLELNRRQYLDDNYQRQAGNAVRGGYLSGVQDVNVTAPDGIPMGTVTGGARPSAILGKEDIGNTLRRNAMRDLLNPDRGGAPSGGPVPQPNIRAGMSDDEVGAEFDRYFAERGTTPNPTSRKAWQDYYRQFGNDDPTYYAGRLAEADEFTGGPLAPLPTIPRTSQPRARSRAESILGVASFGSRILPLAADIFGQFGKAPTPLPPAITAPVPSRVGAGVRFN